MYERAFRGENRAETRERQKRDPTNIVILILVAVAVLFIVNAVFVFIDFNNVDARYRRAIGSFSENARDAASFELMRDYLVKTRARMVAAGLVSSDCGRAWYWERTPDWCMQYQYEYLDALINRTDFYIDRVSSGNISQFSDVYEQMINNMRNEMTRNGPLDWVANPAWYLKYAPNYYWGWNVIGIVLGGFLLPPILVFVVVVLKLD